MNKNTRYSPKSNKNESKKGLCPQGCVDTKTELIKFRVEKDLKEKIKSLSEEKGMSISEMNRELWNDYFNKLWKKEVANW